MQLVIHPGGITRCIYGEAFDLAQLGNLSIQRGSYVEPDEQGRWFVDLAPCGGLVLGPFAQRSQALLAEERWLLERWLIRPADGPVPADQMSLAMIV